MKPEIKFNQKPLDKEEIKQHMNFDTFINAPSLRQSWIGKTAKLTLGTLTATATVVGVSYYFLSAKPENGAVRPFVDPPVINLVTEPGKFKINTKKDTTITVASGTTIFIPAGSFTDSAGTEIAGNVDIAYREFHDQIDFIFSGIPMNYDTAGTTYQFESAGMFEILARKEGTRLRLRQGKKIRVNLVSYNKDNYFSIYYLDTVRRKWVYDQVNTRMCKVQFFGADERSWQAFGSAQNEIKLVEPKRTDPALNNFIIDYNKAEFPELAVYDGVKFEIETKDNALAAKLSQTTWEFAEIRRHDDKHYTVIFGKKEYQKELCARPVFDEKDFEKAMREYEKQRGARIEAAIVSDDSLNKAHLTYSAEVARSSDQNAKFSRAVRQGTVYRSIVIGNLGIWNADYYRQYLSKQEREMIAEQTKLGIPGAQFVKLENGETTHIRGLYLFKRNLNSIYALAGVDLERIPLALVQSADVLVAVTDNYKVRYMMDADLSSMAVSGGKMVFNLRAANDNNEDVKELKSRLRI